MFMHLSLIIAQVAGDGAFMLGLLFILLLQLMLALVFLGIVLAILKAIEKWRLRAKRRI